MRYNLYGDKMEKVDEDKNVKEVGEMLGIHYSFLCKLVQKLNLGYRRAGTSSYRFLTEDDIERIKAEMKVTSYRPRKKK